MYKRQLHLDVAIREMCNIRKRTGFTLIELLVVIAIIAILAAILIPVFVSAKQHAIQMKCLYNLKQLSLAMRQYTDDNNGTMPNLSVTISPNRGVDWCGSHGRNDKVVLNEGSLWHYAKNRDLYQCPSDKNRTDVNPAMFPAADPKHYPLSYSVNFQLNFVKIDSIKNKRPTRILLFIHESRKTINDGYYMWSLTTWDAPDDVHYAGTTLSYLDGHAKWMRAESINKERDAGYWDINKNVP